MDTSHWNFVRNSGLRQFRYSTSIVETFFSLSLESTKVVSQSVINWTVVGQIIRATIQTVIVYHCLQHNTVARVHLRQLILCLSTDRLHTQESDMQRSI